MYCNPTLTEQEFKVLHNTLWELGNIDNPRVQQLVEQIRTVALKGAYAQDNAAFETKHDYYSAFRKDNDLKSTWSIFELPVGGFSEQHPFQGAEQLAYHDHWGDEGPVFQAIEGRTWADLYRAADAVIRRSGDTHHCFIESFRVNPECARQLLLATGS